MQVGFGQAARYLAGFLALRGLAPTRFFAAAGLMVRGLPAFTDVASEGPGSFLNTARQPGLSWDLFWIMQTVTASTFGIAELQRRNASPVQACSCSGV